MRIAIVSNRLPPASGGGAERYAAQLAAALAEHHDVLVVSGGGAAVRGAGLALVDGLPELADQAPLAAKAVWHARDQWRPRVHRQVAAALARFAPDVVHTQQLQGLSAAPFTAVARGRVAHVHSAHDLNVLCVETTMTRGGRPCGGRCVRCALQRAVRGRALRLRLDRLIAPSRMLRDAHVRAGLVPPERAEVIPHGADGAPRVREPNTVLRLGYVGALAPHKGVSTLLDAVAGGPPAWRLAVAGTGPLAERARALAAADERVQYAGPVDGVRKDAFFDALDLVVIPSECEEGATLVAAEAAVRGIPAVVSDRGGLPETPEATVFAAGDPAALRAAIARGAGRLEAASRSLAARWDEFTWETHVRRVAAVLSEAASAGSGRVREH